jgi:hypothetical protein
MFSPQRWEGSTAVGVYVAPEDGRMVAGKLRIDGEADLAFALRRLENLPAEGRESGGLHCQFIARKF